MNGPKAESKRDTTAPAVQQQADQPIGLPASRDFIAPKLPGLSALTSYPTGPRARVYLSATSDLVAIISDADLTLGCGKSNLTQRAVFDLESKLLRGARLGHGGFSPDGEHFTLVVSALPGKLLRVDVPALLSANLHPDAIRYPELPSVNGRHVFSPSGEFFLSYPGSGFPRGIIWNIIEGESSVRVRAGSTFELPGFPSAEAVDRSGEIVGMGVRLNEAGFGLFILDRSHGTSRLLPYSSEITRLAFAPDGSSIWVGDADGALRCYAIGRTPDLCLSPVVQLSRTGIPISALAVLGTSSEVIFGSTDGALFRVSLESGSSSAERQCIGSLTEGYLYSAAGSECGGLLLLGVSSGSALLYQKNPARAEPA